MKCPPSRLSGTLYVRLTHANIGNALLEDTFAMAAEPFTIKKLA